MKYVAVGLLMIILISTWITEYILNNEADDYKCYLKKEASRQAGDSKCPGYWAYCSKCKYKKNFDKEAKFHDREQGD